MNVAVELLTGEPVKLVVYALGGKRVNMLLFLVGFIDDPEKLGKEDFEEASGSQEDGVGARRITREANADKSVGKELLRLTMTALLANSALSLAAENHDEQCFPEDEPQSAARRAACWKKGHRK